MGSTLTDPLLDLRRSIASNIPPLTTTSPDGSAAAEATDNLAIATHLQFSKPNHQSYALDTPTRFISSETPVDLRSIYFAWLKKDVAIPDYIASAQELNEELSNQGGGRGKVQNLVFVERLDLITWLEGASDESEYIKALESDSAALQSTQVLSGAIGDVATVPSALASVRTGKTIDPRLQEIYNGERKMGDRNTILRGIKPTVRVLYAWEIGATPNTSRTFLTFVKLLRFSSTVIVPVQAINLPPPPTSPQTQRWSICPRNLAGDQTQLFYFRPQHLPFFA